MGKTKYPTEETTPLWEACTLILCTSTDKIKL